MGFFDSWVRSQRLNVDARPRPTSRIDISSTSTTWRRPPSRISHTAVAHAVLPRRQVTPKRISTIPRRSIGTRRLCLLYHARHPYHHRYGYAYHAFHHLPPPCSISPFHSSIPPPLRSIIISIISTPRSSCLLYLGSSHFRVSTILSPLFMLLRITALPI